MIKEKSQNLALTVLDDSSDLELRAIEEWAKSLLDIKNSELSKLEKAKKAILITKQTKVILPFVKKLAKVLKNSIWDNRTTKGKIGLSGVALGLTFFSGQSAGIAALGSAIGVPLWIVLGAGGAFAGTLIDEAKLRRKNLQNTYEVMDVE